MNVKILELIQLVNQRCKHIEQLETLSNLLGESKYNGPEHIVCLTTYNSHYDYHCLTDERYQSPSNHVDAVLAEEAKSKRPTQYEDYEGQFDYEESIKPRA